MEWRRQFKSIRRATGLSQEAAARRVGVSVQTWRNWEQGKSVPSRMALERLAAAFPKELQKLSPMWYQKLVKGKDLAV